MATCIVKSTNEGPHSRGVGSNSIQCPDGGDCADLQLPEMNRLLNRPERAARWLAKTLQISQADAVRFGSSMKIRLDLLPALDPRCASEDPLCGPVPYSRGCLGETNYRANPPKITIQSVENETFYTTEPPLTFTVNEKVSLLKYSIDGEANVTISGNTTLSELSYGSHNLTLYATVPSMNNGQPFDKLCEKEGFGQRRISSSHQNDFTVSKKSAVTGRTIRNPFSGKLIFSGNSQFSIFSPRTNNEGVTKIGFFSGFNNFFVAFQRSPLRHPGKPPPARTALPALPSNGLILLR